MAMGDRNEGTFINYWLTSAIVSMKEHMLGFAKNVDSPGRSATTTGLCGAGGIGCRWKSKQVAFMAENSFE